MELRPDEPMIEDDPLTSSESEGGGISRFERKERSPEEGLSGPGDREDAGASDIACPTSTWRLRLVLAP